MNKPKKPMSREDIILNLMGVIEDLKFIRDEADNTLKAIKIWMKKIK